LYSELDKSPIPDFFRFCETLNVVHEGRKSIRCGPLRPTIFKAIEDRENALQEWERTTAKTFEAYKQLQAKILKEIYREKQILRLPCCKYTPQEQ
jgi:hypothetical protein